MPEFDFSSLGKKDQEIKKTAANVEIQPEILPEKKIQKINKKTPKKLHPPLKPELESPGESFEDIYKNIIESSECKRFFYFIYTGKTWRGTNQALEQDLIKRKKEIDLINSPRFSDVIKEMKLNFGNGYLKPSQMK